MIRDFDDTLQQFWPFAKRVEISMQNSAAQIPRIAIALCKRIGLQNCNGSGQQMGQADALAYHNTEILDGELVHGLLAKLVASHDKVRSKFGLSPRHSLKFLKRRARHYTFPQWP